MNRPRSCIGILAAFTLFLPVLSSAYQPISDAEWLALVISGELVAPPELTVTIDEHLTAIRSANPVLTLVTPWVDPAPGELLVRLTSEAFAQYQEGTYTGLDSLNAIYGPVEVAYADERARLLVLVFETHYNSELLAPHYDGAPGVVSASPSGRWGDGPDIIPEALGRYVFEYAWGDCFAGCEWFHYWRYEIGAGGEPVLLDEWGDELDDPMVTGVPAALSPGGARLAVVGANPATSASEIAYAVAAPGNVDLSVYDVTGRRVRTLVSRARDAGTYRASWDLRDESGSPVAAGTYFVLLQAAGSPRAAEKMTVAR